ncbi:MAG: LacI family transcriptional regulator [Chloroflexi bacterium]|nr:LacI family transcriptional regulator [Chloroflexota bacterium]
MSHRITMADVAREAEVSVMTVSRVVNGKDGISITTRQRVQEIIDRLGYRPSTLARSLVTDRTGTVGLVVIDNSNPYFSEVARGVEHVAYAEGYNVFLCNTEEDPQRELRILQSLSDKHVDGVILCSSRLDDADLHSALAAHSHAVLVNRPSGTTEIGEMLLDDAYGGYLATKHLIASGHRAIGYLAGPTQSFSGAQRGTGYRQALTEAGIPLRPEWEQACLPVVENGTEKTLELLSDHPELSALFCYNDLVAVGALKACQQLGRRIPDELAIIGFDDIPLSALVNPSLTTCWSPKYELGSQAMELLLARINGCTDDCTNVIFQPELVIRESAP